MHASVFASVAATYAANTVLKMARQVHKTHVRDVFHERILVIAVQRRFQKDSGPNPPIHQAVHLCLLLTVQAIFYRVVVSVEAEN